MDADGQFHKEQENERDGSSIGVRRNLQLNCKCLHIAGIVESR